MKWADIKKQYPNQFILIGDIIEEHISASQSKIIEANVLEIRDNGKDIMQAYRDYKQKGFEGFTRCRRLQKNLLSKTCRSKEDLHEIRLERGLDLGKYRRCL